MIRTQPTLRERKDELKEKINQSLELVLERCGLPADGSFFRCINPEHQDTTPSAHFYETKGGKVVKCFSCPDGKGTFDAIAVIRHTQGCGYQEALAVGAGIIGADCSFLTSKGKALQPPPVKPVALAPVGGGAAKPKAEDITAEEKVALLESLIPTSKGILQGGAGVKYLASRGVPVEAALSMGVFELAGTDSQRGFIYPSWLKAEQEQPGKVKRNGFPVLMFPLTALEGGVKGYVSRFTTDRKPKADDKVAYTAGTDSAGISGFFGAESLSQNESPVFVTEGEIDALSFRAIGFASISVGSSSKWGRFAEAVVNYGKSHRLPPLILALDTDKAGVAAQDKIATKLAEAGIHFTTLPVDCWSGCTIPGKDGKREAKDANEVLMANKELIKQVAKTACNAVLSPSEGEVMQEDKGSDSSPICEAERVSVLEEGQATALAVLDELFHTLPKKPTATGYSNLDGKTEGAGLLRGGLRGGLSVLIGEPGTGKTAFALSIADNVAKAGGKVMVFSLEMTKSELVCRSLSRISYQLAEMAKDANGVSTGELSTPKDRKANALEAVYFAEKFVRTDSDPQARKALKAVSEYTGFAGNVTYFSGLFSVTVNTIKEGLETFKRENDGCYPSLVVVDYAQIIALDGEDAHLRTDKQAVDFIVKELRKLAGEKGIPFLVVASVNRDSYGKGLTLSSAKESGGIEYSADVIMGLEEVRAELDPKTEKAIKEAVQKDGEKPKAKVDILARLVRLRLLKNRQGAKGVAFFDYKPAYHFFRPVDSKQVAKVLKVIKDNAASTHEVSYRGDPEQEETLFTS